MLVVVLVAQAVAVASWGHAATASIAEFPVPSGGPSAIALGPDGAVWFTEESASKVGRITPAGSLTEYQVPTANAGLGGIATGPDGNVWFTESKTNKLGRVIPATGQIKEFATGKSPGGIVGGADGNLWIMAPQANDVLVVSTAGAVLHTYVIPTTGAYPHGPTLGPDGNVYFAEIDANKIARITPAGQITEWTDPLANAKPMVTAFGPDGKLYFTENQANKIGVLNTSTGSFTHWSVPTSKAAPLGMAAGPDGNLWFTEQQGNNIGRITTSGSVTEFPVPTLAAGLNKIVAGPDGNLWFSETSASKIGRLSPPSAPQVQVAPAISGVPTVGQTLTANPGSWSGSPAPSFSYQWQQCDSSGLNCLPISGATQSTYQLQAGDVGHQVTVAVSGSNTAGQQTVAATPVGPINPAPTPPVNQTPPSISGTPAAGQTLTANPGSWSGTPAPIYTYQWQQCDSSGQSCFDLGGATSSSYQPTAGDVGHTIGVVVTGTNGSGSAKANATPVGPCRPPRPRRRTRSPRRSQALRRRGRR